MKLGTIIHGVLLAAMLMFAYQTWTREDKPETTTGKVKVWDTPAASIAAIVYEEKDKREVRVERRTEGNESYLWAIEKRFTPKVKKKEPPKDKVEPPEDGDDADDGDDGDGDDGDGDDKAEEPEIITHTREYAVGDEGDALLEGLSKLRALHDLGDVTDIAAQDYGLEDTSKWITVELDGGATKKLLLGDKVQGGSNRYALEPESNHGYVLASTVVGGIEAGEPKLKLKSLHSFTDDKLAKIELKSGNNIRNLVRIETKDDKGKAAKTWADATDATKPNQTMANFVKRLGDLEPSQFDTELTTDDLELLLVATYQDATGASIGTLELYKKTTEPEPAKAPEPGPDGADKDGADKDGAAKDDAKKADGANDDAKNADGANNDAKNADGDAVPESPKVDKPQPKPKIEYYIRTQRTRVLATVPKATAERVDADLPTVFE